jgi:hypothetical protein
VSPPRHPTSSGPFCLGGRIKAGGAAIFRRHSASPQGTADASHSFSFDQRRRGCCLRTAMASALLAHRHHISTILALGSAVMLARCQSTGSID